MTGHTGFKGSWLCEWLLGLGAEVWGYSLPPPTRPSLFVQLGLARRLRHGSGDVRDPKALLRAIRGADPDYLFHLAAQPIVRAAYANPAETWSINVMGTVNVLEALRGLGRPCAAVIVTTDKVYGEARHRHREEHPVLGQEPYGASKAAAELAVQAWGRSFGMVKLATARSGNAIGGGDWSADRLLPDCVRSLSKGRTIAIRNPGAVRPWQHVLDPLHGYLMLGAWLASDSRSAPRIPALTVSFNFGPAAGDQRPVRDVVEAMLRQWPGKWRQASTTGAPPETAVLRLDAGKARRILGWRPRWRFGVAVAKTAEWYKGAVSTRAAQQLTRRQIAEFSGETS